MHLPSPPVLRAPGFVAGRWGEDRQPWDLRSARGAVPDTPVNVPQRGLGRRSGVRDRSHSPVDDGEDLVDQVWGAARVVGECRVWSAPVVSTTRAPASRRKRRRPPCTDAALPAARVTPHRRAGLSQRPHATGAGNGRGSVLDGSVSLTECAGFSLSGIRSPAQHYLAARLCAGPV